MKMQNLLYTLLWVCLNNGWHMHVKPVIMYEFKFKLIQFKIHCKKMQVK